jgi:hypothetical protein
VYAKGSVNSAKLKRVLSTQKHLLYSFVAVLSIYCIPTASTGVKQKTTLMLPLHQFDEQKSENVATKSVIAHFELLKPSTGLSPQLVMTISPLPISKLSSNSSSSDSGVISESDLFIGGSGAIELL